MKVALVAVHATVAAAGGLSRAFADAVPLETRLTDIAARVAGAAMLAVGLKIDALTTAVVRALGALHAAVGPHLIRTAAAIVPFFRKVRRSTISVLLWLFGPPHCSIPSNRRRKTCEQSS